MTIFYLKKHLVRVSIGVSAMHLIEITRLFAEKNIVVIHYTGGDFAYNSHLDYRNIVAL